MEQAENREVIFLKKIKSHQLLDSASFEKHTASTGVLLSFLGGPVGCGMSRRRGFFTLQKIPLQQDCNRHSTQQKIRPSEAKPARSHSFHTFPAPRTAPTVHHRHPLTYALLVNY